VNLWIFPKWSSFSREQPKMAKINQKIRDSQTRQHHPSQSSKNGGKFWEGGKELMRLLDTKKFGEGEVGIGRSTATPTRMRWEGGRKMQIRRAPIQGKEGKKTERLVPKLAISMSTTQCLLPILIWKKGKRSEFNHWHFPECIAKMGQN
jgi:hypothetical protein